MLAGQLVRNGQQDRRPVVPVVSIPSGEMKKSYRVFYVGDDSLEHRAVIRANNHAEAVEEAKRKLDADIVTGVRRCMDPHVKAVIWVLAVLLFLFLLVVSLH